MTVKDLLNNLDEAELTRLVGPLPFSHKFEELEGRREECDHLATHGKSEFLKRIRRNCGDFETVFNNTNDFVEDVVSWEHSRHVSWVKMLRTVLVTYDIIANTDRTEEHTVEHNSEDKGYSNSSGNSTSKGNNNETATHQVSASNQTDFHNKHRDTLEGNNNVTSEGKEENEYNREHKDKTVTSVRAYGNIGVTTSQQMLREERQHAVYDIVATIVDEFKKEFCIMVY